MRRCSQPRSRRGEEGASGARHKQLFAGAREECPRGRAAPAVIVGEDGVAGAGRKGAPSGSSRVRGRSGGTACHCWGRWSERWRSGDELVRLDFGVESGKYKRNKRVD